MKQDADALMTLALQSHQISSLSDPARPTLALLQEGPDPSTPQPQRFVGRPYLLWKDDPQLARRINDALVDERVN